MLSNTQKVINMFALEESFLIIASDHLVYSKKKIVRDLECISLYCTCNSTT